jgi:ferredoxin
VEAPTEVHDRPEAARSTATATATATAEVSFVRAGLTAVAEGTLLETAEAVGLAPRNRCRRGICGTCTTPKLSGTVLDSRTGETSDAAGPIRICVSMAQGDVALDL